MLLLARKGGDDEEVEEVSDARGDVMVVVKVRT